MTRNAADLPYRPCVGIMLLNRKGRVFVGNRVDQSVEAWQMPQGGIDEGEDPRGAVLRELEEEIGTGKADIIGEHPEWLTYDLPANLVSATLAAEDARFRSHPGIDVPAIGRAAFQWMRYRRVVSGASTITQQLIKLSRHRSRTLFNKGWEALQACRLEQIWDKQRILAAYFDRLDYGNLNRGVREMARIRPDLYFKALRAGQSMDTYLSTSQTTTVAVDQRYQSALLYYVVGLAQLRDDENTQDARSIALLNRFVSQLTTIAA